MGGSVAPIIAPVVQTGGGGGGGGGGKGGGIVGEFLGGVKNVVDTAVKTATGVVDTTVQAAKAVGDTAYDIKKNPTVAAVLPVIETAVLVTAGVPPPVASAAVAAANGASVEQIATSAAASYVGSQVGGAAGTAAANSGASTAVANAIGSAAGSAASTAVRGGSAQDILTAAAGGAAGSGVGTYAAGQGADLSTVKGIEQATGTLATTGDPTKALIAGGGAYALNEARDATKQAPAPVEDRSTTAPTEEAPLTVDQQLAQMIQQQESAQSVRNNLNQSLEQSNLTPDERAAVQAAIQDVNTQASTAQALPAQPFATDTPAGTSRIGSAFAANDPKFQIALAKNPNLAKAFSEYTNTYGFASVAMNENYAQALTDALLQTPDDPNLREEYKKVTGQDYEQPISVAEQIRRENEAKTLQPLTPVEVSQEPVVNVDLTQPITEPTIAPEDLTLVGNVFAPPTTQPQPEFTPIPADVVTPGTLPAVDVSTGREVIPDDLAIIDLINPRTETGTGTPTQVAQQPPAVEPLPSTSVSTLPPVTTTAEPTVASDDLTLVGNVSAAGGVGGSGGQAPATTGTGGAPIVTLPPVTVTGEREVSPDDLAIIDLITPRGEVPTLPEVTVTPGPEEPERDFDFPEPEDESATEADVTTETPEETPAEKPYKPELFITSKKSAKAFQPRTTTRLGSVTGFGPQTGLTQALTAIRPAGETEGGATGKERQQVWNEASLRLKDALGL